MSAVDEFITDARALDAEAMQLCSLMSEAFEFLTALQALIDELERT